MYRTQIQLREDQSKKLKEMAAEYNVSVAELIRQSIDMLIEQESDDLTIEERWQQTFSIMGKYASDVADLSTNHDKYLAEAYATVK
ncbi:MAG: CopG family transcriptional regulator [Anaerolineae bacterium]|nr:CopG family transcriptional regulator [Anaerolineae bacterium]